MKINKYINNFIFFGFRDTTGWPLDWAPWTLDTIKWPPNCFSFNGFLLGETTRRPFGYVLKGVIGWALG